MADISSEKNHSKQYRMIEDSTVFVPFSDIFHYYLSGVNKKDSRFQNNGEALKTMLPLMYLSSFKTSVDLINGDIIPTAMIETLDVSYKVLQRYLDAGGAETVADVIEGFDEDETQYGLLMRRKVYQRYSKNGSERYTKDGEAETVFPVFTLAKARYNTEADAMDTVPVETITDLIKGKISFGDNSVKTDYLFYLHENSEISEVSFTLEETKRS